MAVSRAIKASYIDTGTTTVRTRMGEDVSVYGERHRLAIEWESSGRIMSYIDVGYRLTSTDHCQKAIREASKEP